MTVRLLPPEVSSKIAAGEVIGRPASVVKELVENSLDAQATKIFVDIKSGGAEYIRVADDASGIPADEVELAFERFATSKVAKVQDLEGIATLGFRGEALPSIAAVAGVSLVTRSNLEEFGTRLDVVDGKTVRKEPQGAPPGTVVEVRNLFNKFPARRKFLRSVATESSRIQMLVTRYAMAYPQVKISLKIEASDTFSSTGSGDLREVISAVYGLEVARAMLDISDSPSVQVDQFPHISGMVSPPSITRANRSYISLFVNRRWVQSRSLTYALEQAYRDFLMERRHPIVVVNIGLRHKEVDVNAHPAKSEVRFIHENQVFSALQKAARHTLITHSPVPEIDRVNVADRDSKGEPRIGAFWPVEPFNTVASSSTAHGRQLQSRPSDAELKPPIPKNTLPVLRVLGQVRNTYIAAEGPDGLFLIDQHAAHERVVFERIRSDVTSRRGRVQSILEPIPLELNVSQWELVESHRELFSSMGFNIEVFGDQTYLMRGVPMLLAEGDPGRAFMDVLDTMAEGGGFESWEDRAAYSIACHSAVRAGKVMSNQEMSELTRQLEECQQPNNCPHGRPTMIHLSERQLEREFGRR